MSCNVYLKRFRLGRQWKVGQKAFFFHRHASFNIKRSLLFGQLEITQTGKTCGKKGDSSCFTSVWLEVVAGKSTACCWSPTMNSLAIGLSLELLLMLPTSYVKELQTYYVTFNSTYKGVYLHTRW